MLFSKFNRVNICALLLLIHLIASSASKIWHPRGLSTMTRIGRSEDSGSDPYLIRLASKRWNPQGLGRLTRVGKRNEDFDSEPSFIHSDYPANELFGYNDQEDAPGLDVYYDNI